MLEFLQLEVEPEFPVLGQDVREEVVLAALHRLKLSHAQLIVTLLTLHTDSQSSELNYHNIKCLQFGDT